MAIPKMDGIGNNPLDQYVDKKKTGGSSNSSSKPKTTVKRKRNNGTGTQRNHPSIEPEMEEELEKWLLNFALGVLQEEESASQEPSSNNNTAVGQGSSYQDPPADSTIYGHGSGGSGSQSSWWTMLENELSNGSENQPDHTLPAIDGDPNLFPLYIEMYSEPEYEGATYSMNYFNNNFGSQYEYRNEFGYNSCGYFAATGGEFEDMVKIHNNYEGSTYTSEYGIQPSELYNEVDAYYSLQGGSATQSQYNTISDLAEAIDTGGIVVVDIRVGEETKPNPTEEIDFAHFAEVLAVDFDSETVVLANSLSYPDKEEISFDEFYEIWFDPENLSEYGMAHDEYEKETVVNWMMVVDKGNTEN